MLSDNKLRTLVFVAENYAVLRSLIQSELFPEFDAQGCMMRKLLSELYAEGLINKTRGKVVFTDRQGQPPPVWFSSRKGLDAIASHTGEAKWLDCCCRTPQWQMLHHYVAVAEFGLRLRKAADAEARIENWTGEWEEKSHDGSASAPEDRYRLFTLVRETPRLVASPDAGWEFVYKDRRKVQFLEFDRHTTGAKAIAASKPPGFAGMAEQQLHRRILPQTTSADFSVFSVSLTPNRRDLLRSLMKDKPGARLWRFVSWTDWTPEKIFREPIIYDCEKGPYPMIKRGTEEGTVVGAQRTEGV
jgi:Replication-relaxation